MRAAGATDAYRPESPWQALALGTVWGFAIGVLVARRDWRLLGTTG
jgi:ElaB/YqjD/DUF883 family membrane-anchored ribosome-binding protein